MEKLRRHNLDWLHFISGWKSQERRRFKVPWGSNSYEDSAVHLLGSLIDWNEHVHNKHRFYPSFFLMNFYLRGRFESQTMDIYNWGTNVTKKRFSKKFFPSHDGVDHDERDLSQKMFLPFGYNSFLLFPSFIILEAVSANWIHLAWGIFSGFIWRWRNEYTWKTNHCERRFIDVMATIFFQDQTVPLILVTESSNLVREGNSLISHYNFHFPSFCEWQLIRCTHGEHKLDDELKWREISLLLFCHRIYFWCPLIWMWKWRERKEDHKEWRVCKENQEISLRVYNPIAMFGCKWGWKEESLVLVNRIKIWGECLSHSFYIFICLVFQEPSFFCFAQTKFNQLSFSSIFPKTLFIPKILAHLNFHSLITVNIFHLPSICCLLCVPLWSKHVNTFPAIDKLAFCSNGCNFVLKVDFMILLLDTR